MLLYLLRWLREEHPEIHFTVLSLYDGGLSNQFKEVCHEYYELSKISNSKQNFIQRLPKRMARKLGLNYNYPDAQNDFIENLAQREFDIIYANTTVSLPLAQRMKSLNNRAKLILHVHELESEIKRTICGFDEYLSSIDFMIAASRMVRNNLIENHQVEANKIKVVYEFSKKLKPTDVSRVTKTVFRVGGSGKFGHRKGTDLFIQIARYLDDNFPNLNIEFTWVGLVPEHEEVNLKLELEKLELSNRINFVGEVEKPESYFENFDVFLMTSREDPFPLVCIEAGMLGVPIICFDKATGISEIIEDKGGFIIPYLNVEEMAGKIDFYLNNPEKREEHSRFNKKEFAKFTVNHKGSEILKVLKEL